MKIIRIIMIGLIAFNGFLVFTSAMGIFNYGGPLYEGENVSEVQGINVTSMDDVSFFSIINPKAEAAVASIAILSGCGILAWATHSTAPIAAGASLALFTGLWIQTYSTLSQFPIPAYFLAMGTVMLAIIMIIDVIDIMGGRQYG